MLIKAGIRHREPAALKAGQTKGRGWHIPTGQAHEAGCLGVHTIFTQKLGDQWQRTCGIGGKEDHIGSTGFGRRRNARNGGHDAILRKRIVADCDNRRPRIGRARTNGRKPDVANRVAIMHNHDVALAVARGIGRQPGCCRLECLAKDKDVATRDVGVVRKAQNIDAAAADGNTCGVCLLGENRAEDDLRPLVDGFYRHRLRLPRLTASAVDPQINLHARQVGNRQFGGILQA